MKDAMTNTPDQAARFDRSQAWQDDERDYDDGVRADPKPHTCTSPDPARCLFCALDAAVREQKEAERVRQEVINQRHREHWEAS